MTVFCPNCGKPNTDEATKCVACGAELKKQGAKKFKGTMMMQTPPIAQKPGASEPAPGAVPPAPARPMSDRPQGPAAGSKAPPAPAPGARNLAFQKTMLGPMVAPQTPGSPSQPAGPPGTPGVPGGAASKPAQPFGGPSDAATSPSTDLPTRSSFGTAPTMASPTSPQFGAPPTASEFGGLPRSGGATPSSPGSAPSQPAAFGGSNAPKAPAPPAFGQGGGFGQPPAGGGFGAPTGGGGGSDANDAARDKKKKLLFAAIGCLALVVLGCIGSCVFFYFQVKDQATALPEDGAAMNPMLEKLARVPLAFVLGNVVSECRNDPSGESIRSFFHPSTFDDIKGNICASSDEALEVFSDPSRSQVFNLSTRPEADLAKEAGYDPNTCFLFDSASGQVITCRDEANHTLIVGYRVDATP